MMYLALINTFLSLALIITGISHPDITKREVVRVSTRTGFMNVLYWVVAFLPTGFIPMWAFYGVACLATLMAIGIAMVIGHYHRDFEEDTILIYTHN